MDKEVLLKCDWVPTPEKFLKASSRDPICQKVTVIKARLRSPEGNKDANRVPVTD